MNDFGDRLPGTATPAAETPDAGAAEAFAARCAHDFNNLLTGILGNLELMQNRARRAGITQFDGYLEGACNAAGRAAGFARRLSTFSGQPAHEKVPIGPNRLLADLAELLQAQGAVVTLVLASDAGQVVCDPHQLEVVLNELLTNAAEAAAEPGATAPSFELATERAGGTIVISVRDHGPGLTPEVALQAGTPFFSTRVGGPGKGLGLAIVNRFARREGGSFSLETPADGGAVARLILPRAGD